MKKIILTGESGFIGKAVLDKLDLDICVTSISRRLLNDETPSIIRYQKDLCDLTSEDLNVFYGVDVVIHCAALAHLLKEDKKSSLNEYRRVNRDATIKLAELAARAKVPRFIYISSIGVNGNKNTFPFLESDIPNPHDSYSLSKFEAEQSLLKLSKETDLEVVIIRPPLVYGPNAPGNFATLVKWVKKKFPMPLGSVNNKRSFVALDNLVDFILLCADKKRSPNAANEIFLISDGVDISLSDLLRKVANAYDIDCRLVPIPVRFMTFLAKSIGKHRAVERLFCNLQIDSTKANDLLGWKPAVTIDEQLAKIANKK